MFKRGLAWGLVLALTALLLAWALRGARFERVWAAVALMRADQVAALLALNLAILSLSGARWWLILRSMGSRVAFVPVTLYRLAGFAVSYITPGPQFGGEPLQLLLLARRHAEPGARAVSSIYLDKLIELLANLTFAVIGLLTLAVAGLQEDLFSAWLPGLLLAVMAFPALHLAALWRGRLPLTRLSGWLLRRYPRAWLAKVNEGVCHAEREIARVGQESPRLLLGLIALIVLGWAAALLEYALIARFLGAPLSLSQTFIAVTLARFAFAAPIPGGLGALEASQVLSMRLLGFDPAIGLSISLVARARDALLVGAGLLIGGALAGRKVVGPLDPAQ